MIDRLAKDFPVVTYGMSARADFRASNYRPELPAPRINSMRPARAISCVCPLIGRFNVANSLAALAAANSLGIPLRDAILSLAKSPQVPGVWKRFRRSASFRSSLITRTHLMPCLMCSKHCANSHRAN